MPGYDKETIRAMVEGTLDAATILHMQRATKDEDRFDKYIQVLQDKTKLPEPIVLRLGEHLYIVQKGPEFIVKCDCGQEFGDYRVNWKLNALVYARETEEDLDPLYPGPTKGRVGAQQLREFCCPGCGALLDVEALPVGYPVLFDFLPDLDPFYAKWLHRPLEGAPEMQDKTYEVTSCWANER